MWSDAEITNVGIPVPGPFVSMGVSRCNKGSWISAVWDQLPFSLHFQCSNKAGKGLQNSSLSIPNANSNAVSIAKVAKVACPKAKAKNPLILGIKFEKDQEEHLDSASALCTGDKKLWTNLTRGSHRAQDLTDVLICPGQTATCALRANIRNSTGKIVGIELGCCNYLIVSPLNRRDLRRNS